MCDYCKIDEYGDSVSKDIISYNQKGIIAEFSVYGRVDFNKLSVLIGVGENDIRDWSVDINYCPMCGRKLEDESI